MLDVAQRCSVMGYSAALREAADSGEAELEHTGLLGTAADVSRWGMSPVQHLGQFGLQTPQPGGLEEVEEQLRAQC